MGMGIPWALSDPSAYARADRARRDAGAITSLLGSGAGLVRGAVKQGATEEAENDEITRLRAALGLQEQKAVQQSEYGKPGFTNTNLGTGETTVLRPAEPEGSVDRGLRMLGTGVRRAAVGAGLYPDTGGAGRRQELARLKGQLQLTTAKGKLTGQLSKVIAGAKDPGAAVGQMAPWMGVRPGDLAQKPGTTGKPSWPSTYLDAAGGDADLARRMYVEDQQKIHPPKATSAGSEDFMHAMAEQMRSGGKGKADSRPESDQGGSQTGEGSSDDDADQARSAFRRMMGGSAEPAEEGAPGAPPHPVREHAAQRKAAVIRDARGMPMNY